MRDRTDALREGEDMTIDFKTPPQLTLFPETQEQEIIQNLYCIINTELGTVPLLRDYGLDMSYMHMPTQEAKALMIAAISDAVSRYEPRVSIENINFDDDAEHPEQLHPSVGVKINEE